MPRHRRDVIKKPAGSGRRTSRDVSWRPAGWDALAYAVIEQAIDDVRALQAAGVIVDGRAREGRWRPVLRYRTPMEVNRLLAWLRDGAAQEWLDMLTTSITARQICRQLGIEANGRVSTRIVGVGNGVTDAVPGPVTEQERADLEQLPASVDGPNAARERSARSDDTLRGDVGSLDSEGGKHV